MIYCKIYINTPLVNFCQRYVYVDDFPILSIRGIKYVSLFESSYCCEQFFYKLNLTKSPFRSSLTDQNDKMELRVATSFTSADIAHLTREKNFTPFQ